MELNKLPTHKDHSNQTIDERWNSFTNATETIIISIIIGYRCIYTHEATPLLRSKPIENYKER